ncbi:MAG: AAA family ATPase [Lachnospiraceae bacterium]|nr:AAA family ATPase [Lachnospiraceae bacterium]
MSMNIQQAKEFIRDTVKLYLKKDEYGEYRIPVVRQRPVFLLGAPGVGKTAIMEQIAQELGIALVSYSMTHHTRQSALGLPFISHKTYDGQSFDISEYTMSEIIASVYEVMEKSGVKEGILFLDEINCVSETLAPSMLQFLQYKVFGRHQVPDGWVIVTAGNPPEYNKSVREFDVVTLDRMKILEVEPDYKTFRNYAKAKNLHGAVLNYLELKKDDFYVMETTVKGRSFVTARGWEDLSDILKLYEEEGIKADEALVGQYIRNDRIVREFTAYYDLYNKYKQDYKIAEIFSGNAPESAYERAAKAGLDERLALMGLLVDKIQKELEETVDDSTVLSTLMPMLLAVKQSERPVKDMLELQKLGKEKALEQKRTAGALSSEEKRIGKAMLQFFADCIKEINLAGNDNREADFAIVKKAFDEKKSLLQTKVLSKKERLHALFTFVNKAFGEGNEMLLLLTELTVHDKSARFIALFGSDDYNEFNNHLMVTKRQDELLKEIENLEI